MRYVELSEAKRHLNVEEAFRDDDAYIAGLIDAALMHVERL